MSTEQNKAAIRRAYEEAFNKGNMAVLDEIMAPEYVLQGSHGLEFKGSAAFKKYIVMIRAALPDLFVTPVEILAEGDKVVHRARYRGTHTKDLMGIAATGNKVEFEGITISRFANGKEVEAFAVIDTFTMYQQLGVIPPIGQAGK